MKFNLRAFSYSHAAVLGVLVWLTLVPAWPADPGHDRWARILLLLAVLVWVPLALEQLDRGRANTPVWQPLLTLLSALALVAAMLQPAGSLAALLSLPWLCITGGVFLKGVEALFQARGRAAAVALAAGRIFLIIGGLFTTADRLGVQPLGFDPAIILLTGVHFHFAGFIFTLLLGWAAERRGGALFRAAAWLAVVAVPLTAAGITAAQVWSDFRLEALAAGSVALAGWLGAAAYLREASMSNTPWQTRIFWAVLGVSLIFTMSLALAYALRPYYPLAWLNIPSMRAWHGTVNALGVAGGGLLGWRWIKS